MRHLSLKACLIGSHEPVQYLITLLQDAEKSRDGYVSRKARPATTSSREATMVLPTNVSALAAFLLLPNNAVDAFSTHHASVRILYVVDAPMS